MVKGTEEEATKVEIRNDSKKDCGGWMKGLLGKRREGERRGEEYWEREEEGREEVRGR